MGIDSVDRTENIVTVGSVAKAKSLLRELKKQHKINQRGGYPWDKGTPVKLGNGKSYLPSFEGTFQIVIK